MSKLLVKTLGAFRTIGLEPEILEAPKGATSITQLRLLCGQAGRGEVSNMPNSFPQSKSPLLGWVKFAPQLASTLSILVACAVLTGWALDVVGLRNVLTGQPQMVPNTALSFILASVALWLSRTEQMARKWSRAAQLCAGVVVIISLVTLAEYLLSQDLGIDKLLFPGALQRSVPSFPGRPSPHTAASFLLLGTSLLLLAVRSVWSRSLSQYFAIGTALVAMLALVGYAYRIAFLYSISPNTGMALHTALTFLVLSLGCLSARPSYGLVSIVTSETAGGIMARQLLPTACLLPMVFGGLIVAGQRAGFYDAAFGMAFCAVASIFVLSLLILRNAKTLYRVDLERHQAERDLRKAKDDLEVRVKERTGELSRVNEVLQSEMVEHVQAEAGRLQLLRQLVTTQEEERRRISRELHDRMGQHVSALILGLKTTKAQCSSPAAPDNWLRLENLADQLAEKVHDLAWELRPAALDDLGLHTALSNYLEKWSKRSGIAVDLQDDGLEKPRLPSQVETTVYRVVQEALTNVVKHACPRHVSVILERHRDQMLAIVEDDGKGFDLETVNNEGSVSQGLGLLGMRERVALVGGIFNIETEPGSGTTLVMRIPISHAGVSQP